VLPKGEEKEFELRVSNVYTCDNDMMRWMTMKIVAATSFFSSAAAQGVRSFRFS
jgi:hypothetical protein